MQTTSVHKNENGILNQVLYKYMPYWPLFVLLVVVCCVAAWKYTARLTPSYEATASIMIKDDGEMSSAAKVMESMNALSSKASVENEIEVLHSRSLMEKVVERMHLYANVMDAKDFKTAYATSPVIVKLKDVTALKEQWSVPFVFDKATKEVIVNDQKYKLDEWVNTAYGTLQFSKNEHQKAEPKGPLAFQLLKPADVAGALLGNFFITPVSKTSSVVVLKLKDAVPERGEAVLNTLADVYSQESVSDKNATAENTLQFLDDRIKYVEDDLDSLEHKIQRYKSQRGIVDLSTQGHLFLDGVSANDKKLGELNMQVAVLDQVEKYVVGKNNANGIVPSTLGINNSMLDGLLQKLYDAEIQYEKLRKTTPENNPLVVKVRSEIDNMRPSILENVRNQRVSAFAGMNQLNASINSFSAQLRSIPQKEKELLDYTRQQAVKNSVYTFLLQKREEIGLSLSSTAANSRLIDTAKASVIPNDSKKYTVYVLALVFALVAGAAFVHAREMFSSKILFRRELEASTTMPVIGELARVKTESPLIVGQKKRIIITEQFRQTCVALGLYSPYAKRKKILVTSSIAGEGKSFVSANLALTLALSGKKVVLVDLDLRNPQSSETFGMTDAKGAVDFLKGAVQSTEILRPTECNNLYMIPAGAPTENSIELLLNGRVDALFADLEKDFDYIVADTSPVDPVSDAYILSNYCDVTLYVVRHGYTPKTTIQMLDENNKLKELSNLVVVFNAVKPRGFMRNGYGVGYGYGYMNVYRSSVYGKTAQQIKYN